MARFRYLAMNPATSQVVENVVEALDKKQVRSLLRDQGLIPRTIEPLDVEESARVRKKPVKADDLVQFSTQFAILIKSSIPVVEALSILEDQTENPYFKQVIREMGVAVIGGRTLSEAMAFFPRIFDRIYISMVKAGEQSGTLDTMLDRLAAYLESQNELRRKVISAFTYPAIVVTVVTSVVLIMLVFVVPVFKKLYTAKKSALPLPTQILLNISDFIVQYWWLLALIIFGTIYLFNIYRTSTTGKPVVDQYILRLPIFGKLMHKIYISRFARTLSTVFGAGLTITSALEIVSEVVDNTVINQSIHQVQERVNAGQSIAGSMAQTGIFPKMVCRMVAVGEETGSLEAMLSKTADFLDQETDFVIKRLATLLEPTITIVLGIIVGAIALAMYMPLFELSKIIRK